MSWAQRVIAGVGPLAPASMEALFAAQVASWGRLGSGVENLRNARSREFAVRGARIRAVHIPHRIESTTAPVDPDSIRNRPCFLCEENLPPAQRGLTFGGDFLALCNPFPILSRHVTIVRRAHAPQRIFGLKDGGSKGDFRTLLEIAAALPGYMVLYNGPECGASAPDHMHFQAGRTDGVPIFGDLGRVSGARIPGDPRHAAVFSGSDPARIEERFDRLYAALRERDPDRPEPMLNLVAAREGESWRVLVFPRARHRPGVFHTGRLTWSPGSIDMCGLVVLPVESDLDRITVEDIESVYEEVSLPGPDFDAVVGKLEGK